MAAFKLITLSTLSVLGTGTIGTAGAYGATLTTIKDYLKDDLLGSESTLDSEWTELQKILKKTSDIDKYSIKELKDAQGSEENPSSGSAVKNWCEKQQGLRINPYFNFLNKNFLEAVETFCVRTIESKLGENKIDLEAGQETFKTKLTILKSHSGSDHGNLDQELTEIKNRSEDAVGWEKLKNWCAKTYKRGYNKTSDRENLWKLAERYCKKP